jgi:hypothetical protein
VIPAKYRHVIHFSLEQNLSPDQVPGSFFPELHAVLIWDFGSGIFSS